MKKITIFALVLVLAISLCACRMGGNEEPTTIPTTVPTTAAPTTMPDPTIIDPTILDPTIETNIPDTNVDDDHLIDPTANEGGDTAGDTTPNIRRRFN